MRKSALPVFTATAIILGICPACSKKDPEPDTPKVTPAVPATEKMKEEEPNRAAFTNSFLKRFRAAVNLVHDNRWEEAAEAYRDALDYADKKLQSHPDDWYNCVMGAATAFYETENYTVAETYYRMALESARQGGSDAHTEGQILFSIARMCAGQGRHADALAMYDEGIPKLIEAFGREKTVNSLRALSFMLENEGQTALAVDITQRANRLEESPPAAPPPEPTAETASPNAPDRAPPPSIPAG